MRDCDLLITVGRQLDYQLGFGSPAVFKNATVVRIADTASELIDNRRGEVEILADPAAALDALATALADAEPDTSWRDELRAKHEKRSAEYRTALAESPAGADGMHPNQIFAALDALDGSALDLGETVMIADGGDLLSFARLGITRCARYLDPGAFGCLGVGTPFAIAASLAYPDRPVVAVTGDGAFGITAMDIDTAVRHGAKIVVIVSNNPAWNIERYDQAENYGLVVGTELADSDYAALGRSPRRARRAGHRRRGARRTRSGAPSRTPRRSSTSSPPRTRRRPTPTRAWASCPTTRPSRPWNDAEIERRKA